MNGNEGVESGLVNLRNTHNTIDSIGFYDGAPGRARTCNPRLRRPVLYPVELRAHVA